MRYQKIESRIWNDERFVNLTPLQQRLFLYILTSPHGNLLGLYVLKKGYIIEDLKVLSKDLERDLKGVLKTGMVEYDEQLGVVWIKKFLKHNPLTNPNQKKAVPRILSDLPKSYLIQEFIKSYERTYEGLGKDFLSPSEVNPKPESETEEETETETETELSRSESAPAASKNGNDDFERFWIAYPRKVGKEKARQAWRARNGTRPPVEQLITKITELKQSRQWQDEGGRFIPHPTTWINRGGWHDELPGQEDYIETESAKARKLALGE